MKYLIPFALAVVIVAGFTSLLREPDAHERAVKFCTETGGVPVMVSYDRPSGLVLNCIYPTTIVPEGDM